MSVWDAYQAVWSAIPLWSVALVAFVVIAIIFLRVADKP